MIKKIFICTFCSVVFFSANLLAQNMDSIINEAQRLIDAKELYQAEKYLKDVLDNGMDSLAVHYELAWCYYCMQDYRKAAEILESLTQRTDVVADVYQLLGNAYDEMKQSNRAMSVYEKGLERFPDAACLYLERGNISYKNGDFLNALYYYEKGIEAEPEYASNYYRSAMIFLSSTEEVWAVMYGELFMNLEKNSERCKKMSRNLYDTYFSEISLERNKVVVDFNNSIIVYSNSVERPNLFPEAFRQAMTKACKGEKFLDIKTLIRIRTRFIQEFYRSYSEFDNVLFDYHKKLLQSGHFEAYNYWLFAYGNSAEAANWAKANKSKWDSFLKWFEANPINIDRNNIFTRYNME